MFDEIWSQIKEGYTKIKDPETRSKYIRQNIVRIITFITWVLVILGSILVVIFADLNYQMIIDLINFFQTPLGMVAFLGLFAISAFTITSAFTLAILSGLLYGIFLGSTLSIIGALLAASIGYYLGKFMFSGNGNGSESGKTSRFKALRIVKNNEFESILVSRLLLLPFDFISYGAGALKMRLRSLLLATLIGSIPPTLAYSSFGTSIKSLNDIENFHIELQYLALGGALMLGSIILSRLIRKYFSKS